MKLARTMDDNSLSRRVTAFCSILVGILYCIVGLTHFLMPRENLLLATGVSRAFFESLASGSAAFSIHYWAFIVASLLAIGVVSGLSELIGSPKAVLVKLSAAWGVVGFSVTALNFAFMHHQAMALAGRFNGLEPSVQTGVLVTGLHNVDPYSLMSFGLVGAWSLTVNSLGYRWGRLPKALALIGCVGGALYEMVFLGTVMGSEVLIDIAAAGAMVLGPVWFIWLGLFLVRRRSGVAGGTAEQAAGADVAC